MAFSFLPCCSLDEDSEDNKSSAQALSGPSMASPGALNISAAAITLMGLSFTGLPWLPPGHCIFLLCQCHLQQRGQTLRLTFRLSAGGNNRSSIAPKMLHLREQGSLEKKYRTMKCVFVKFKVYLL